MAGNVLYVYTQVRFQHEGFEWAGFAPSMPLEPDRASMINGNPDSGLESNTAVRAMPLILSADAAALGEGASGGHRPELAASAVANGPCPSTGLGRRTPPRPAKYHSPKLLTQGRLADQPIGSDLAASAIAHDLFTALNRRCDSI